jgi:hypothetical protein
MSDDPDEQTPIDEALTNALSALKRADHIYYVSLKYARTVDVMRNLVDRIIATLEYTGEALAKLRAQEGVLPEWPETKPDRAAILMRLRSDAIGKEIIEQLIFLRKLRRAEFERASEFRKAVTMTVHLPEGDLAITTDTMKEWLDRLKFLFEQVFKEVKGEDALL